MANEQNYDELDRHAFRTRKAETNRQAAIDLIELALIAAFFAVLIPSIGMLCGLLR